MTFTPTQTRRMWARALSLRERSALLYRIRHREALTGEEAARSAGRLARWKQQRPFERTGAFGDRLRADGLDEATLTEVLRTDFAFALPDDSWATRLAEGLGQTPVDPAGSVVSPSPFGGLLVFVERFVLDGFGKLVEALSRIGGFARIGPEPKAAAQLVVPPLLQRLYAQIHRTLLLELHVARLQGRLSETSPEARFREYVALLRDASYTAELLAEYPVLGRSIVMTIDAWVAHWTEVFTRLAGDRSLLTTMCGDRMGALEGISAGAGDTHDGGRSVAILHFAGGRSVVYKPRPLAVDTAFGALTAWLAETAGGPTLRRLSVIDRGTYGWVEFVEHAPCRNRAEVDAFYERLGVQLALLYVLEATDMHLENVIASGPDPVLVDLEALFHPRVPRAAGGTPVAANAIGWEAYQNSVMRIGLLPSRVFDSSGSDGVEVSGVGGAAGQLSPDEQPVIEAAGTDAMRIVRKRVPLPSAKNQPALDGIAVRPADHVDRIVHGFEGAYRALQQHRDALTAAGGPLRAFAQVPVRAVLRNTRTYARLWMESFHPDVMRDALDRTRHFDHLWATTEMAPWLAPIVPFEQRDLERGDIPLFRARPDSRSVWTSNGLELPDLFAEPSYASVLARIARLSDEDRDRQVWYIRASLTSLAAEAPHGMAGPDGGEAPARRASSSGRSAAPRADETRTAALAQARRLADQLIKQSVEHGDDVAWIGLALVNERYWALQPVGDDLYGGRTGIALFLLYLDQLVPDPRARHLAGCVLRAIRQPALWDVGPDPLRDTHRRLVANELGAFRMLGGSVYALIHAAVRWEDSSMLADIDGILACAERVIDDDDTLDIIGGAAGLLMAAAAVVRLADGAVARRVVTACAEHLLRRADRDGGQYAWRTSMKAHHPLTGVSHGASGMALALFTAFELTGEARYAVAARGALAYEEAERRRNGGTHWPDYREVSGGASGGVWPEMMAWCHGAPGIGLVRALLLRHVGAGEPSAELREALVTALASTERNGFRGGHSLCHGGLGNLALLSEAARLPGFEQYGAHAARVEAALVGDIATRGPLCGTPNGVETPGLMMGLAGIGMGLLRIAAPDVVPNVLSLEPPRRPA